MDIFEDLKTIEKSVNSKKVKAALQRVRERAAELEREVGAQQELYWFHPLTATPENGEIVVIACDVDAGNDQKAQILQTAIYEQREDKTEAWHCGQPFILLKRWCRLPLVPKDTIVIPKAPSIVL